MRAPRARPAAGDQDVLAVVVWPDGSRDILGSWIEQTEGAKFWMKVFPDLKTRGGQRDGFAPDHRFIANPDPAGELRRPNP
jgi:hypothetical protein